MLVFRCVRRGSYKVTHGGTGYDAGRPPTAKIEPPPFMTDTARATTKLKPSGSVFRVALRSPGRGYETAPEVAISPPRYICFFIRVRLIFWVVTAGFGLDFGGEL